MKLSMFGAEVDGSEIARVSGEILYIGELETPLFMLGFPDRTPRDKLEAIAKAINDALSAARELEGLGRD